MNRLSALNITQITSQISPNLVLHPTSIAYLQFLLTPYAQALDTALTVDSVINWIPQALPGIIREIPVTTAVNNLSRLKGGLTDGPEFVDLAKNTVVDELIKRFVKAVDDDILFYKGDNVILPWDIKESMFFDDFLGQRFGVVKGDGTLPVEVVIGNSRYTHNFSEELTMGILLYSLLSQTSIQIFVFGIPFTNDYFLDPRGNRYTKLCHNARRPEFSVEISGATYCFITTAFMQGFATGASWFNDDHHRYWTNLISYEQNPLGVQVTF